MKPETEYQILLTRFRIKKFLQDQWPLLGHTRGGGGVFRTLLFPCNKAFLQTQFTYMIFILLQSFTEKKRFTRELE